MNLLEILKLPVALTLSCISFSLTSQNAMMVIDSAKGLIPSGLFIEHGDIYGIVINSAGVDGIQINSAGRNGVSVFLAGGDGVEVENAGGDGVHVEYAGRDGVRVDNADGWSMNIQGSKNLVATPSGHIAQIFNRASSGSADVLALKVGQSANPNATSNFITFFDGDDDALGRIEGNGSGGVVFTSGGADFAEYIPVLSNEKGFKAGDIVGIIDGKATYNTNQTNKVLVITDRPIVVGNQQEDDSDFQMVSFIGQVPVRVKGKVNAGDWIVASGLNDGTGVAISPTEVTLNHKIVGQAWESSTDSGIKRVNTAVGLDKSQAKDTIIRKMQDKIDNQSEILLSQQSINIDFQAQINKLKQLILKG